MFFLRWCSLFLWVLPLETYGEFACFEKSQAAAIEITLKNGLKICLKSTDYAAEEISFQIFAMGGYAGLTALDRPSAILAPDIAMESGLAHQSGEALSFNLYQNSIDLEVKIQAFDRQIEGNAPTDKLEQCLQLIRLLFTEPMFKPDAFKEVLSKTRQMLQIKSQLYGKELTPDEFFLKTNTQNWDIWNPLKVKDLDSVSLHKAEKFFKQAFSNPAQFKAVFVGDFDPKAILPILEKYLGSIPVQEGLELPSTSLPSFPANVTKKEFQGFSRYKKPLTHLTFPVLVKIEGTSHLNLLCQLIKNRLNKHLMQIYESNKKLEVNYEFPFFPRLDIAWLTIEFSSLPNEIDPISMMTLNVLKQLREQGPSEEDLKELHDSSEEALEIEENSYILSILATYYRANWNINLLCQIPNGNQVEKEVIKNDLNRYFDLNQYSKISLYP